MAGLLQKATVVLLVLILVGTFSFGCGPEPPPFPTPYIGFLVALTGPAAPTGTPITYASLDTARYYNENNVIPGVKLKPISYDTHSNLNRVASGYEWLRSKGTDVVVCVSAEEAEILKARAEQDQCLIMCLNMSMDLLEDPGWVFSTTCPVKWSTWTLMKWISEHDWDYTQGIPRIGYVGYVEPANQDKMESMKEYAVAHPDEFAWVDGILLPSTSTFENAAETLKDCDYVGSAGIAMGTFWEAYLAAGHTKAKLIDPDGNIFTMLGAMTDMNGWEPYDKAISMGPVLGWGEREKSVVVQRLWEMLHDYPPYKETDAEIERYSTVDLGYVAGGQSIAIVYDILGRALKKAGGQHLGRAYYDAAVKYKMDTSLWRSYPAWSYTETKHYLAEDMAVFRINATKQSLDWTGEWVPLVEDPNF